MKKRISQIIALSVLGLLVVGLILCSVLKLDFKPELKVPTTESLGKIQIATSSGTSEVDSSNENINVEKFAETFDNSFKLTVLYSVFSGKVGSKTKLTKQTTAPSFTGFKVQFIYNEAVILKNNGEEVKLADNSNENVTYNRVLFDVANGNGLTDINIYFYTNGSSNYYKVTTIGNFDELYNYISNLSMFGE